MKKQIAAGIAAASLALSVGVALAPSASAASSSRCSYTSSQPTLRYGSTGTAVKQLQCELYYSVLSSNLTRDGSFGPATLSDVRKFQSCAHLVVDGIVGPNTWSSLNYYTSSSKFAC
jgi:peptidoglycan hydrolase-like protein with peptidoglycan-binding domain